MVAHFYIYRKTSNYLWSFLRAFFFILNFWNKSFKNGKHTINYFSKPHLPNKSLKKFVLNLLFGSTITVPTYTEENHPLRLCRFWNSFYKIKFNQSIFCGDLNTL